MDSQRMFGMTTWVRRLLVANLLVFLCQQTVLVDPRFQALFGFQPLYALERPWTFVTYMFLHANLLHLAFNLLALFMFGPPVEERMGGRAFVTYYLLCGLGGGARSGACGAGRNRACWCSRRGRRGGRGRRPRVPSADARRANETPSRPRWTACWTRFRRAASIVSHPPSASSSRR